MTALAPLPPVRVEAVELHHVSVPLRSPFRTSFGTETDHEVLLVRVLADGVHGWAECVAARAPAYSSEYLAGAGDVLRRFLAPPLLTGAPVDAVALAAGPWAWVKGHRMAKAALETALLDAQLRVAERSLAEHLGAVRDRVPSGVSVGIMDSVPQLLDAVQGYLDAGYRRIKLKVEPGWDLEPVAAVRERWPDVALQVDANTAYARSDAEHLARLDAYDLLLVEQPLDEEDLVGHAQLAARLRTPVCLDESVVDTRSAVDAVELGACAVVNVKPGRVGGYLESVRLHDACRGRGVPVWCGGMLETGVGRAANLALAALPGFTLPGDTSASDRYYATDLTTPFALEPDGCIAVPTGPGIGVDPEPDRLAAVTLDVERLRP